MNSTPPAARPVRFSSSAVTAAPPPKPSMDEPAPPSSERPRFKKKAKRSSGLLHSGATRPDQLDSLPWNKSVANDTDDPFLLLGGGDEGGFLSLEEIDESEYGFIGEAPDSNNGAKRENKNLKSKKRKRGDADLVGEEEEEAEQEQQLQKEKKKKKKKNKKRDRKKKNKNEEKEDMANKEAKEDREMNDEVVATEGKDEDALDNDDPHGDDDDNLLLKDDDVYAWKELRLHPLLIKSIRRLGFREPTPIQKACIPAAAHQGKDVIGAAETGSGKTLAFGLPILQRFLEEWEKDARAIQKSEEPAAEVIRGGPLRALIVTPTRELALQVSDHMKKAAKFLDIQVVPIVGGMSSEKQERLLKRRPEIIVGTPGRLWELMSAGNKHLVELHSLSFFVLDEADRMIETGHFHELQSIIDMLPMKNSSSQQTSEITQNCQTVPTLQLKKRQTFIFSATIALPENFRKKLKKGVSSSKPSVSDGLSSMVTLLEKAGIRHDAAKVDLTNAKIMAMKLEESFLECSEEDKEAYLYYILSVHGQGRTIVFCTSIAALRRISSVLRILRINAWTLHSQMQQRARLKAMDRFRGNEHSVLIATDVAARGLDIHGIRTVVHYQLPHSAEVYIHRSGRTARASADGCCIALISPSDKTKFFSLCKSLDKESLHRFPVENAYMPEVLKRLSLARQVDKLLRKSSQENSNERWLKRNAESLELNTEDDDSEEEKVQGHKQKKLNSIQLKKLQQELNEHLKHPLQPKTFSHRFLAGSGVSPLLQQQLEVLSKTSFGKTSSKNDKKTGLVVIGQDCVEPLQALRTFGNEVCVSTDKSREFKKLAVARQQKKREVKKRAREKLRKDRKKAKEDTTE